MKPPYVQFLVPELNFNANDYSEISDWQKCLLTEPPITVAISDETLEKMILKREVPELNKFPCHTQAVERYVKQWQRPRLLCVVLRAETDTVIRARLAFRRKMPSFNSKCYYHAQAEQSESDDE